MAGKPHKWIVTANFTADGAVAYLKADGGYGRHLKEAQVFDRKEDAEAGRQSLLAAEREISDPYLAEVDATPQGPGPLSARERIRDQGPTVPVRRADPVTPKGPASAASDA